jgi:hypothetical protein
MKKMIVVIALLVLGAVLMGAAAATMKGVAPLLTIEMFARNEKVIPLSYEHGDYKCIHVKPPEILVRNISGKAVTLKRASIVGKSDGREVARFTIHEDRIGELMAAENKKINKYMSALDDADMAYRLRRIHGEPAVMEAGYHEGHALPPSAYACLGLTDALFFFYEGTSVVDALEIVVEAEGAGGAASSVVCDLPYTPYTCQGEYHFPIEGACMVGSIPFGHSHRFANGQEFAIDILDIRRNDDAAARCGPSPMARCSRSPTGIPTSSPRIRKSILASASSG